MVLPEKPFVELVWFVDKNSVSGDTKLLPARVPMLRFILATSEHLLSIRSYLYYPLLIREIRVIPQVPFRASSHLVGRSKTLQRTNIHSYLSGSVPTPGHPLLLRNSPCLRDKDVQRNNINLVDLKHSAISGAPSRPAASPCPV